MGMSASEIAEVYNLENGKQIMDATFMDSALDIKQTIPKYDGMGKTKVLKQFFNTKTLNDAKIPLLIVSYNLTSRNIELFEKSEFPDYKIVDIANATSAAPCYFPPYQVII